MQKLSESQKQFLIDYFFKPESSDRNFVYNLLTYGDCLSDNSLHFDKEIKPYIYFDVMFYKRHYKFDLDGFLNSEYYLKTVEKILSETKPNTDFWKPIFNQPQKETEIIEDIQKALVDAGGRFFRFSEINKMTVEELLKQLLPNSIEVNIKFKK